MNVQNINNTNFNFQNINNTLPQNGTVQLTNSVFDSYQNNQFEYSRNNVNSLISPPLNKPVLQKEVSLKATRQTKKSAAKAKKEDDKKMALYDHANHCVQKYIDHTSKITIPNRWGTEKPITGLWMHHMRWVDKCKEKTGNSYLPAKGKH